MNPRLEDFEPGCPKPPLRTDHDMKAAPVIKIMNVPQRDLAWTQRPKGLCTPVPNPVNYPVT